MVARVTAIATYTMYICTYQLLMMGQNLTFCWTPYITSLVAQQKILGSSTDFVHGNFQGPGPNFNGLGLLA